MMEADLMRGLHRSGAQGRRRSAGARLTGLYPTGIDLKAESLSLMKNQGRRLLRSAWQTKWFLVEGGGKPWVFLERARLNS